MAPFPYDLLAQEAARYPAAAIFWVQEEPQARTRARAPPPPPPPQAHSLVCDSDIGSDRRVHNLPG